MNSFRHFRIRAPDFSNLFEYTNTPDFYMMNSSIRILIHFNKKII